MKKKLLSDDERAYAVAFGAKKRDETGKPGVVVVTRPGHSIRRTYLTDVELAAMLDLTRGVNERTGTLVYVIDDTGAHTEVVKPDPTKH